MFCLSKQDSRKKADKNKSLHQNFRLFSRQQTTAKKAGNGMVLFLSMLGFDVTAIKMNDTGTSEEKCSESSPGVF